MLEQEESLHFLDYWRVVRSRKEIVIAVSLLFVLTGIVVTYSLPRVYMASTVIQVQKSQPDVQVFDREHLLFDPLFMRTQFEIIQSAPVIEEVVRKRDLVRKLSGAYGYADLAPDQAFDLTFERISNAMKVQQYRDTNLIEIQIYMDEPKRSAPEEAAQTANAFADVFRDLNDRRNRKATERALMALQEELQEQDKRVKTAESRVQQIREQYQIALVNPEAGGASALSKRSLIELEGQRVAVRMELADKKSRFDMLQAMGNEQLLAAAPYVVQDPSLIGLVNERRKGEVELQQLRKAYGPNYPEVVRAQATIDGLNREIQDALEGLKAGIAADYQAAVAKYNIIEAELKAIKESEIDAESRGYREFEEAYAELERLRRIRNDLEVRHVQERIEMRIPRTSVTVIEPAKAPDTNAFVSPKFVLNILLSIVVGLGAGVGLAYFIEYLDTSVKTIEDVERFMQLPVIGVIPQKVKPFVDEDAEMMHAEPYRMLRTNIQFSKHTANGKTFCVTSGSVGEGKSLTLFNLAYVCAQLGDKVLLVDSDLHRPRQHKILGMSNAVGLANVLSGETTVDDAIVPTTVQNLDFLSSGKLRGAVHGLLATRKMHELTLALRERYDYIFFDAPPIIGVSDASLLVREMDGVLLVVQHRKYPKGVSARAKDMVENMGGKIVGVVLNSINVSRDYSSYYYQSYSYSRYVREQERVS